MATTELRRYLQSLAGCIENQDRDNTAQLLSLRDAHAHLLGPKVGVQDVDGYATAYFNGVDRDVAVNHLRAAAATSEGNTEAALAHQLKVVQAWRTHMEQEQDTNWSLKPLNSICFDLRRIAALRDEEMVLQGEKPVALEAAMAEITHCFRTLSADKCSDANRNKKRGMIFLVNHLLCIAFKLNNFAFLKAIFRVMDGQREMERLYAMSHVVTFRYYMGRRAMYEADYSAADQHLSYAFEHCHRDSVTNRRLILIHLIPVNLLLGRLPQEQLLAENGLEQFRGIIAAFRAGHMGYLDQELSTHQDFFVQWGVFLVLEKVRLLAYRNLFKKVWRVMGTHQIKLEAFLVALRAAGETTVDVEEVECILANLIHQRLVKGYIAQKQGTLVLSKKEAFPSISKS